MKTKISNSISRIALLNLLITVDLLSQNIIFNSTPFYGNVDLTTCDTQRINIGINYMAAYFDLCFGLKGEMYGLNNLVNDMELMMWDPKSMPNPQYQTLLQNRNDTMNYMKSFPKANSYSAITMDSKGNIFIGGTGLYRYNTISKTLNYLGDFPRYVDGLTFYNGQLIGIWIDSSRQSYSVVQVDISNPMNSKVLFPLDNKDYKFTNTPLTEEMLMSNIVIDCDSIIPVLVSFPYINNGGKAKEQIFKINFNTEKLELLCPDIINVKKINDVKGIGTLTGHLASRCNLSIDLDENDNTAIFNDYRDSTICQANLLALHDSDLWLYSKDDIDLLSIQLIGTVPDQGYESLLATTIDPRFNLNFLNPQTVEITPKVNGLSYVDFKNQITKIFYQNTKKNFTSGERSIVFKVFSGLFVDSATARLKLYSPLIGGIDTNVVICPNTKDVDLFSLLQSPKMTGGNWYFNQQLHSGIIQGNGTSEGNYLYILNRKDCSPDTSILSIKIPKPLNPDLGKDIALCPLDRITLKPKDKANTYLWSDGSSKDYLEVIQPGTYSVAIRDSFLCEYYDTIHINYADYERLSLDTFICANKIISWRNKILNTSGIFNDTASSLVGCDTIFELNLKATPNPVINSSIQLCENDSFAYKNKFFKAGQIIYDTVKSVTTCDTLLEIKIIARNQSIQMIPILLCNNDSIEIKSKFYKGGEVLNDTISSLGVCDTIIEYHFKNHPQEKLTIIADTIVCKNTTSKIECVGNFKSYKWSTGEFTPNLTKSKGVYRVTATDQNNCNIEKEIQINEIEEITYSIEKNSPNCPGERGQLKVNNTKGGRNPIQYFLNGQKINIENTFELDPGIYTFETIDSLGCKTKENITITAAKSIDFYSINDTIQLEKGSSFTLSLSNIEQILEIEIIPNSNVKIDSSRILFFPIENSSFSFRILTKDSCESNRNIYFIIIDKKNSGTYIPTIFSPNGDQINDIWFPVLDPNSSILSLSIYDRWGAQIYASNANDAVWDGKFNGEFCNPGVYVYHVIIKNDVGIKTEYSGDFFLIK